MQLKFPTEKTAQMQFKFKKQHSDVCNFLLIPGTKKVTETPDFLVDFWSREFKPLYLSYILQTINYYSKLLTIIACYSKLFQQEINVRIGCDLSSFIQHDQKMAAVVHIFAKEIKLKKFIVS